MRKRKTGLTLLLASCISTAAYADSMLADFQYPYPVQRYEFKSQGQALAMAYMDVRPPSPNAKTVVASPVAPLICLCGLPVAR